MAPTDGPTDVGAAAGEEPQDPGRAAWERARRRGFGAAGTERADEVRPAAADEVVVPRGGEPDGTLDPAAALRRWGAGEKR